VASRLLSSLLGLVALVSLFFPVSAVARSLTVSDADVAMSLAPDAALLVTERLTVDYEGSWEATFRDIILKKGETITNVSVTEGGQPYRPGGCTAEGCVDAAATFGVAGIPSGGGVRIVWHPKATDETRTFSVSYLVEDAVVAYSDVLDVEWQV
jgi:uncharacterized membrane protein